MRKITIVFVASILTFLFFNSGVFADKDKQRGERGRRGERPQKADRHRERMPQPNRSKADRPPRPKESKPKLERPSPKTDPSPKKPEARPAKPKKPEVKPKASPEKLRKERHARLETESHREHHHRYHHHHDWYKSRWSFGVGLSGLSVYYGPSDPFGFRPCFYPVAPYYPPVWEPEEYFYYYYGSKYPDGCFIHGIHHYGHCKWYYREDRSVMLYYYP